jgi:hypothetical protein
MCDGSFELNDFPFTIGGEVFDKVWMIVDVSGWNLWNSPLPPIAHFVKPLPAPIGDIEALYSLWQLLHLCELQQ